MGAQMHCRAILQEENAASAEGSRRRKFSVEIN